MTKILFFVGFMLVGSGGIWAAWYYAPGDAPSSPAQIAQSRLEAESANQAVHDFKDAGGIWHATTFDEAVEEVQHMRIPHYTSMGSPAGSTDYSYYDNIDPALVGFDPDTHSFIRLKHDE